MKTLDLPLCANWYHLIESGEKPEEYREITWWILSRIMPPVIIGGVGTGRYTFLDAVMGNEYEKANAFIQRWKAEGLLPTHVRFRYGYTRRTQTFCLSDIHFGVGEEQWGAPSHEVMILSLGEKVESTDALFQKTTEN